MEIAGICLAAERNEIPVFSMKVVSDGADEEATESFGEVLEKGFPNTKNSCLMCSMRCPTSKLRRFHRQRCKINNNKYATHKKANIDKHKYN